MANDLNQSLDVDDEIDLREIIKILIESKKLLISTILIFTIASIIYSFSLKPSFISSTKLEIGYFEKPDGSKILLETSSDLISELRLLLLRNPDNKFSQNVSITPKESRVVEFTTNSSSIEKNENLLTEMLNYIDKRHSNLEKLGQDKNSNILSIDIKNTEAQINYLESKLSDQSQSQYLKIISSLQKQDEAKEMLDLLYRNSEYKDKLFYLNQKLANLTNELNKYNYSVLSKSQIIGNIKTKKIKPETQSIIALGIIFGFITGIFLIFIRNFVKSYKEGQA